MKTHDLESTIGTLMASGKGILAADEGEPRMAVGRTLVRDHCANPLREREER